jgi:hypothetical protein
LTKLFLFFTGNLLRFGAAAGALKAEGNDERNANVCVWSGEYSFQPRRRAAAVPVSIFQEEVRYVAGTRQAEAVASVRQMERAALIATHWLRLHDLNGIRGRERGGLAAFRGN